MKSLQIYFLFLVLAVSSSWGFQGDMDMRNENEISDEARTGRMDSESDYDPSFLDDIIGPDYFDDSKEGSLPKDTQKQLNKLPNGVSVIPDPDNVESEIVSEKAPCTGCPMEVDIEDAKIKEIAMFALQSFGDFGDEDPARALVRVIKAQTQVVAGQKYILKIEGGYLNCTKANYLASPEYCVLDPQEETFTCDFEIVEQSWANSKEVVASECQKSKIQVVGDDLEDVEAVTGIVTGQTEWDETTAGSAIGGSDESTEMSSSYRRKKRDVATTDAPSSHSHPVGKLREAEESSEILMEMAKLAVEQLDEIDEDDNKRFPLQVLKAKKQTVSGWLYHLKIRVAQTSCKEGKEITLESCKDKMELPYSICNVKILFQPWQTVQKKVTESQCFPEKMKTSKKIARKLFFDSDGYKNKNNRVLKKHKKEGANDNNGSGEQIVGAPTKVSPDSPELQTLIQFAVETVDAQSNALHAQKLVRVIDAQRQLVSGILTKLTLETGYTDCRKNPNLDKSKCNIDEQREHQFCEIHVWEKPWLNEKKVTKSRCGKREEIMKRKKRSLIGGDDHDYKAHEIARFGQFVDKYSKNYDTAEEYKYRLGIFNENMKKVKLLQDTEQGTATYGATIFADLTDEEFSQRHLGLRPDLRQRSKVKKAKIPVLTKLPPDFDWRAYNAVTPVKNQGQCGSCWAFSVTGNIEGLYAKKHQNLVSFSEQELVDCDTLDQGCGGGLPENAYKSLMKLGGLESEEAYPYDGRNEKCNFKSADATAKVIGSVEVSQNETEMAAWLVKNGPISIGINANAMQFYFGGVSHPWKYLCSPKSLDHGVLIVGYGVHTTTVRHKTMPYWLVKNSWGPHWGEQGYYRVYRGDGTCGINQMATSAVIA